MYISLQNGCSPATFLVETESRNTYSNAERNMAEKASDGPSPHSPSLRLGLPAPQPSKWLVVIAHPAGVWQMVWISQYVTIPCSRELVRCTHVANESRSRHTFHQAVDESWGIIIPWCVAPFCKVALVEMCCEWLIYVAFRVNFVLKCVTICLSRPPSLLLFSITIAPTNRDTQSESEF